MSFDPTDTCADLQPQLAAYALGEAEAADELLEHLAICPACQRDLRAYVQIARMLPHDAVDVAPPPELRARILAAVEESAHPAAGKPAQPVPAQRTASASPDAPHGPAWGRRLPTLRPAFAFMAVVLIVLLGWNVSLQSQLNTQRTQIAAVRENWQTMIVLLNDPAVHWYAVAGDTAHGHFWVAPQSAVGCLVAQELPALTADQVYQVWLVHRGEHTSAGIFEARNGNGWILVHADEPLANYDTLGVTIEPRGGSDAPTSSPVMLGSIVAAQAPTASDRRQTLRIVALQAP
jgi:anti-sigma-K factor RskA